jgi:hypothetical protein
MNRGAKAGGDSGSHSTGIAKGGLKVARGPQRSGIEGAGACLDAKTAA